MWWTNQASRGWVHYCSERRNTLRDKVNLFHATKTDSLWAGECRERRQFRRKGDAALPIEENSVRLRTQLEGHWQLWGAVKTGQFWGQVGVILTNLGSIWVVLTWGGPWRQLCCESTPPRCFIWWSSPSSSASSSRSSTWTTAPRSHCSIARTRSSWRSSWNAPRSWSFPMCQQGSGGFLGTSRPSFRCGYRFSSVSSNSFELDGYTYKAYKVLTQISLIVKLEMPLT